MQDYNFDGEIHALSKDWSYAIKSVGQFNFNENDSTFTELRDEFYKKYAEYLYSFDKKKVLEILINYLCGFVFHTPEDFSIIYRPPWEFDALSQNGTFAIKFKRSKEDNLDD